MSKDKLKKEVHQTRELTIPEEIIENKIFIIRGQRVMISTHLADLYEVEPRVLMQAVRRNINRFPEDFMFPLTREEIMNLSQIVTSSKIKHAPNIYAFTEQGIAMLSSVLNSERAVQVNIAIMRTFVKLRKLLLSHRDLARKLEELERKYDAQFKVVFDAIRQIMSPQIKPVKKIGFDTVLKETSDK